MINENIEGVKIVLKSAKLPGAVATVELLEGDFILMRNFLNILASGALQEDEIRKKASCIVTGLRCV